MVPNYFKKWFGKKTSTLKYTQPCRVLTTNPAVVGPVWNKRSLLAAAPECAFTWNSFCFCGTLLSTCLRAELEKVRRATCWSAWEQQEPAKSPHEKGYGPISRKKIKKQSKNDTTIIFGLNTLWKRMEWKLEVSTTVPALAEANGSGLRR